MSFVAHGYMGVFISAGIFAIFGGRISLTVVLVSFLLGAFPDIAGYLDGLIRGKEYRWTKGMYGYFHNRDAHNELWSKWWFKVIIYIPHIYIHLFIDKYTHDKETGKWNTLGYFLDLGFWLIIITNVLVQMF